MPTRRRHCARLRREPLSNYERNIRRILNPPPLTLRDRLHLVAGRAENLWWRHVTRRELFRQFDTLKCAAPPYTPTTDAEVRRRLARLATDYHEATVRSRTTSTASAPHPDINLAKPQAAE
ncbi:hypothetical protein [Streptomyces sp. NPDC006645]|uniref:hypothetical protein n=1 Tax=unclassified Streptomyces TaxID=2593676 RepID=UPI0033A5C265